MEYLVPCLDRGFYSISTMRTARACRSCSGHVTKAAAAVFLRYSHSLTLPGLFAHGCTVLGLRSVVPLTRWTHSLPARSRERRWPATSTQRRRSIPLRASAVLLFRSAAPNMLRVVHISSVRVGFGWQVTDHRCILATCGRSHSARLHVRGTVLNLSN